MLPKCLKRKRKMIAGHIKKAGTRITILVPGSPN
jgi:hypothetical protein